MYLPPVKKVLSNNQNRNGKAKLKKWSHVQEYCENSTIHGLRYFSKQNIHWFERLCWIIIVLCSLVACCVTIYQSYKKWDKNPVIVTFSEKMTHMKFIPFPAVTICPETKSKRSIFNYTATLLKVNQSAPPLYNLTEREYKLASAQFQICETYVVDNENNIGENFTSDVIFDLIREVAPELTDTLVACTFRTDNNSSCSDYFEEIVTDDGLCFTFNSLTPKRMFTDNVNDKFMSSYNNFKYSNMWSLEDGYANGFDDNSTAKIYLYPNRVYSAGSKAGLKVAMSTRIEDIDYACRGPIQGFKVILHTPNELPQVDGQFFRIPVGQDVRVSIKPNMMRTSRSLTNYSPNRRQCFFNFERKLRYMRTYTKRNCELECLANFTLDSCGCVKFSMPHDATTPICGIAKVNCYISAENDLLEDTETIEMSRKINSCNCLPACTSLSYDTEVTQATYEWKNFFKALHLTEEQTEELQFASISIFFKENQFITSKRSELIGLNDFVASCGGLLGLFMGVSILSIVELVYYFSLRLFCSIRSMHNIDDDDKGQKTLPKLRRRSRWGSARQMSQRVKPWYIGKS